MSASNIDEKEYQELKQRRKRLAEKQVAFRRFYIFVGVALIFQMGIAGGIFLSSRGSKKMHKINPASSMVASKGTTVPVTRVPALSYKKTEERAPLKLAMKERLLLKETESGRERHRAKISKRASKKMSTALPAKETRKPVSAGTHFVSTVRPAEYDLLHSYAAGVRAIVARHKENPSAVSGKRVEGRCLVICIIKRDGTLKHAELIKSSGNALLDSAAVRSVRNVGRFPKVPDAVDGDEFSFDVPVNFNIPG